MMNDFMKSQPHSAYGSCGGNFLIIFFFLFFRCLVSMATNENGQWVNNHVYDTRQRKEDFCKIIAMAW